MQDRRTFYKYYPDLPVVNTDPDTLYDNLKMLIKDPGLRIDIGKGAGFS